MQIEDPKAEQRSIMSNKLEICSGQKTGVPCKHYWFHVAKVLSNNADFLRDGEKHRACLISPGFPVEFSEDTVPHTCNQYSKRKKPGLLGILGQYETYQPLEEEYRPVSTEERKALEEENPSEISFTMNVNAMTQNIASIADREALKAKKAKAGEARDNDSDSLSPDELHDLLDSLKDTSKDKKND